MAQNGLWWKTGACHTPWICQHPQPLLSFPLYPISLQDISYECQDHWGSEKCTKSEMSMIYKFFQLLCWHNKVLFYCSLGSTINQGSINDFRKSDEERAGWGTVPPECYHVELKAQWSACGCLCVWERERERGMRAFGLWPCSISMSGSQTSHFSSHTSAFSDKCCHIPAALWRERARQVIVQKLNGSFTALQPTVMTT